MALLFPPYEAAPWYVRLVLHCFEYETLPFIHAYAHEGKTTGVPDDPRWDIALFRFAALHPRG